MATRAYIRSYSSVQLVAATSLSEELGPLQNLTIMALPLDAAKFLRRSLGNDLRDLSVLWSPLLLVLEEEGFLRGCFLCE